MLAMLLQCCYNLTHGNALPLQPSIAGECETLYRVSPWAPTSDNPMMYITKVRNYHNCLERPMFFSSMFHLRQCAECVREQVSVSSGSVNEVFVDVLLGCPVGG